jgi:formylglycine-generating enzyme required for sulfatase activity
MGRGTTGNNQCPASANAGPGACNADEVPQHTVTLEPYAIDRFEATVGRFRTFVNGWSYDSPPVGAGANPFIEYGGWQSQWTANLPTTQAELVATLSCSPDQTWTDTPGANESLPINCVSWYLGVRVLRLGWRPASDGGGVGVRGGERRQRRSLPVG